MKLKAVTIGDLIKNRGSGKVYVVISDYPLVAIRSVSVTNPTEWQKVNFGAGDNKPSYEDLE